jgi:hypothetical protein
VSETTVEKPVFIPYNEYVQGEYDRWWRTCLSLGLRPPFDDRERKRRLEEAELLVPFDAEADRRE